MSVKNTRTPPDASSRSVLSEVMLYSVRYESLYKTLVPSTYAFFSWLSPQKCGKFRTLRNWIREPRFRQNTNVKTGSNDEMLFSAKEVEKEGSTAEVASSFVHGSWDGYGDGEPCIGRKRRCIIGRGGCELISIFRTFPNAQNAYNPSILVLPPLFIYSYIPLQQSTNNPLKTCFSHFFLIFTI